MSGGDNYTKNKIVEMMVGDWAFKKDGTEVTVKIGSRKLSITTTVKGTSTLEEISAGSQWLNDKLLFTEKQKYYVKHADEYEMILGEVKAPALNDVLWERKFERS